MPLAQPRHQLIRGIESDLNGIDRLGVSAAARFGSMARVKAINALRRTNEVDAVRGVIRQTIVGDASGKGGVAELLASAMLAAHLAGRRRTGLSVKTRLGHELRLSASAFDGALDFLRNRLQLSQRDLVGLSNRYDAAALRVVETSSARLERAAQQAVLDAISAGEGARGGADALRAAFTSQGYVAGADYQLEAIFRTQTNMAYSAGRWESLQDPALDDILWGFEYSAILDDRTTELCMSLDGTTRPKDDPFWDTYTPPNHWNCRSTILEVLDKGTPTRTKPALLPQDGFRFNPGDVFGD